MDIRDIKALEITGNRRISFVAGGMARAEPVDRRTLQG